MARVNADPGLWPDLESNASHRLLMAALDCFASRGYHAATTREIAERAGMSPAAVYVHYKSKAELLYAITSTAHEKLLGELRAALDGVEDPRERLRLFVETFASWHVRHHTVARVAQYELRALPTRGFARIAKMRGEFERMLEEELGRGVEAGLFTVPNLPGTALAVMSMCIDVARWYQPMRPETPESLSELYSGLVLRMISR
jgi:AcrR family transcriptional regulator